MSSVGAMQDRCCQLTEGYNCCEEGRMSTLTIHDLNVSKELDDQALKKIMGGVRNRETTPILLRKGFEKEKQAFLDLIRQN